MQIDYQVIKEYFDRTLEMHEKGPTAVDWNSKEAQIIRFQQLTKIFPEEIQDSVHICDFGCGLGALFDYLKTKYSNFLYTGIDINPKMIDKASYTHRDNEQIQEFVCGYEIIKDYDYIVESGIFNARNSATNEQWLSYIIDTLYMFNAHSKKGFAFNCLTKYSDETHMKKYLYYADPCQLFDYCKTHFSRNVTLLHDYDIYDFTIIVRK